MGAMKLDLGTLEKPGPGLVPLIYAGVLAILSVCLLIRTFLSTKIFATSIEWRSIAPVLLALTFYGVAIEWLGYVICTFLITLALLRATRTSWIHSAAFAVATTVVIDLLFVRWLSVLLPTGSVFP